MGLGMFTLTFNGFPLIGQKVFMSCRKTARSGVGTWICEMDRWVETVVKGEREVILKQKVEG